MAALSLRVSSYLALEKEEDVKIVEFKSSDSIKDVKERLQELYQIDPDTVKLKLIDLDSNVHHLKNDSLMLAAYDTSNDWNLHIVDPEEVDSKPKKAPPPVPVRKNSSIDKETWSSRPEIDSSIFELEEEQYTASDDTVNLNDVPAVSAKYTIKKLLGRTGFSQVFSATHKENGDDVAIKVILKDSGLNAENEKKSLKKIPHSDSIIHFIDSIEDGDQSYLIFELMKGGHLLDTLQKKTDYNEKVACQIVKKLLLSIKTCHENDIIHKDINLENLMLEKEGDLSVMKLIGFSLSLISPGGVETDPMMAELVYQAPELVMSKSYTKAVDMWSAGIVAYILLCGHPPFFDSNNMRLKVLIRKGILNTDNDEWNSISSKAKDFISLLLKTNDAERGTVDDALASAWISEGSANEETLTNFHPNLEQYFKDLGV